MGSSTSSNFSYSSIYQNSEKPGESSIYRHPKCLQSLINSPDPKILTLQDLLNNSYKFSTKPCFGTLKNGIYNWKTYKECLDISKSFGSGLFHLGIDPVCADYKEFNANFVAIYSKNREEFLYADYSCIFYNWVSLPIYDTLGGEALDFIFDQTEVELLVCSLENLTKLITEKRFGKLKNIVTFDPIVDETHKKTLSELNLKYFTFQEVLQAGQAHLREPNTDITPSTVYTFSYTSGTTGKPKGAMLTHGNFVSVVANGVNALDINANDVYLSYLPLAHVLEKIVMCVLLYSGSQIGFYNGDVQKLKEDLAILKPTIFVTVPRLLLRFHDVIKSGLAKLKGCKQSLAIKAVATKLHNLKTNGTITHSLYDKLIFSKMKLALGGRVRWILVGSAPTSSEVLNFLKIAFCCNILEGYGQTEATGASFVTNILDNRSAGCVGGPCVNTEYKLFDVPEMNYTALDKNEDGISVPRGEMCVRGYGVFKGYYKDLEKTNEAIDSDGWLHTGDIVQINPNGTIKIIDRKKNIFKLSHGEYVAAEKIESVYLQNPLITEIFVYGDSLQSYLVAVIVPNIALVKDLAKKNVILIENIEDLLKMKEIKNIILAEINKTAKEAKLLGFEIVKNIHLEQNSFGLKDLLTTTFKLKRHEAKKCYEKEISQLYEANIGN